MGMNLKVARGFALGTKIETINVPEALRVKHTSGIEWLDDALGGEGGFTPTQTMMLTGMPGAGKSTMLRMLADSLTKAGHLSIYNTGEESLYQAKMSCEKLKLSQNFHVGEERMLPKILTFLDTFKAQNSGKQIFFLQDSLQTLDDGKYVDAKGNSRGTTGATPVHCSEMLVDWMQANFGICVFIGQCTKNGDFAGRNTIKHAVDTHAHMFIDDKEKSDTYGALLFEIQKNRWGCNGKTYILGRGDGGVLEERGHITKFTG
jgi:DNA repair protein RadA/Sms